MSKPIVPAVIPASLNELRNILGKLVFSPEVHVDVVDGQFVPSVSWPYDPYGLPLEIKSVTDSFTLEVDLMVEEPLPAARDWLLTGADMLVLHVESISVADFKRFVDDCKVSVGIAALNDTAYADLKPYLEVADYAQVMGIAQIGAQGKGQDERVFSRISQIKNDFPKCPITVDGSVNLTTIKKLSLAGADRFICGSAIVGAENPKSAYLELREAIN